MNRPVKPLDFGGEGVTGSVNGDGRIIALNFYHPKHGYVTLTSAAPFPESERYNPTTVRAYRSSLVEQDGFGVHFAVPITERRHVLQESTVPEIELHFGSGKAAVMTIACAQGAIQRIDVPPGVPSAARWGGRLCLQRCAYTQLTEGGPLPMPPLRMRVLAREGLLVIHNPELEAAVVIEGLGVPEDMELESDQPLRLEFVLGAARYRTITYGVGLTVKEAVINARWLMQNAGAEYSAAVNRWQSLWHGLPDDPLVHRGIVYAMMNAVPVDEGACLLTDHMLLPLSWNRDAYFAARALLSAGQPDIVRRHLLWTFETAERPNGVWARCYLANGRVKDRAYQLDQQLYPLLELAEYVLETGDEETYARLCPHIETVLAALDASRSSGELLYPTDETPADDPIALPYHFSSHVLIWHTLNRLKALGAAGKWSPRLPELRATIQRTFIAQHDGRRIYAYATDTIGRFQFYHDANDFPLVLAVAWGFVPADDPVWRATVDFAFSVANRGFYAGHLGSVHSPAPWALGDVQALIVARALGDTEREQWAQQSLRRAAQLDGALPEAYDAASGAVFSRHWFAWTNAALACVILGAFD